MKTLRTVLAAIAALPLVVATPAQAQTQWSLVPHLGLNIDNDELYVGANARIELPSAPVTLNPGFDWYPFIGSQNVNASLFVIDMDVLYHLKAQSVEPYVGGGLFWSRSSVNVAGVGGGSATDVGLNLKGGAVFRPLGKLRPFAEGVIAISGGSGFLLKGGFLFSMGG